MTKKEILKLIEKELDSKTKKQIKQVQDHFEKSYVDIKEFINNKLTVNIKQEVMDYNNKPLDTIINLKKEQEEKFNKLKEEVDFLVKKVNKEGVRRKRIREEILKKFEKDTEDVRNKLKY